MIKFLLTILFPLSLSAQCIPGKKDTVPVYLHITDNLTYFDYYHKNGVLLWKNVKDYKVDKALIPSGGYYIQKSLVNPKATIVNRYKVFIEDAKCKLYHFRWLDINYKPIDTLKKFVTPSFLPRVK